MHHPPPDVEQEASVIRCVITRMVLRKPWHVLSAYAAHLSLKHRLKTHTVPGLLKATFLCEGARTCYSLSIWSGPPRFSSHLPEHIDVVNALFGRLARDAAGRPQLWSTTWQLEGASNNLVWDDLDLSSSCLPAVSGAPPTSQGRLS